MVECSNCRRHWGDGQTYCGECGQPTVRKDAAVNHFVQFFKFSLLALGGFVAVVFMMAFLGASRTDSVIVPRAGSTSQSPIEIEAAALAKLFEANEIRAKQQYQDVPIKVRGRITSIGIEILGRPYLVLDDAVQVVFTQADSSRLARFDKGDIVTARCESPSKLVYVVMTGCLF